jgi:hypothetical protein
VVAGGVFIVDGTRIGESNSPQIMGGGKTNARQGPQDTSECHIYYGNFGYDDAVVNRESGARDFSTRHS